VITFEVQFDKLSTCPAVQLTNLQTSGLCIYKRLLVIRGSVMLSNGHTDENMSR